MNRIQANLTESNILMSSAMFVFFGSIGRAVKVRTLIKTGSTYCTKVSDSCLIVAACQQRTLTPPDTWSCPALGLACVLMSRPISPELVLSPDF